MPDSHELLLFGFGSSTMISTVPMNMFSHDNPVCNNVVTGIWTSSAEREQSKFGTSHSVFDDVARQGPLISTLPPTHEWDVRDDADFVHYCDNETATGFEFNDFPYEVFEEQYIVSDLSSNIGSKFIDWTKLDVGYACA